MLKQTSIILIMLSAFLFSCTKKVEEEKKEPLTEKPQALFEYLDSSQTGINFDNKITETERFNFLLYESLYNGAGLAIGDINNDGLQDIYFTGNMTPNKLYLNRGDFKFEDITESSGAHGGRGFKTGVTMVDINNDGFLDIYVCKSAIGDPELRRNVLYINNGDLTFTERAAEYGLDDPSYSMQAYFFDMDGDNNLDVYLVNHPNDMREANAIKITQNKDGELALATPTTYDYVSDRLYKNTNGKFSDITKKAGVLNHAFGLSAVIGDFNNDALPDIYVANDYIKPDQLLINQGNNTFEDQLEDYFRQTSFSSMGSDYADINNNGCFDLLTLDMLPSDNFRRKMMSQSQNYDKFEKMLRYDLKAQFASNALQINSCTGNFSNIAYMNDVALTEWSWSVLLADYDNDGLKDIHITNGYVRDITHNDYSKFKMDRLQKQLNAKEITLTEWIEEIPSVPVPAFIFKNQGNNMFDNYSSNWDSGTPSFSNGSAYADLNNDGFLDLVVSNINEQPFIMKNNGASLNNNSFLSLSFEHNPNEILLGTKAQAHLSDGTVITEQYNPTRGFLSSSQHRLHFGVKEGLSVSKLDVIWPDQTMQTIENPTLNQILSITKNASKEYKTPKNEYEYFEDVSQKLPNETNHVENDYIDFKREALLHHKYSEEGPAIAVADINGDGLQDMFLGGAKDFEAKIFLQTPSGNFVKKRNSDIENDRQYEDVSALLFDANGNGNLDLYVVSGGNEHLANNPLYQDRLYLNDGNGNFKKSTNALPNFYESGSVVKAHDIDGDGQLDLFVGSRLTPGRYPEVPQSYLLKNNNGVFKDVTDQWSEGLKNIGLITDATFKDLNNNGTKELILAGEWMPVSVFEFENGTFKNQTISYGLDNQKGWWYSLLVEDLNGDDYPEIIAGNLGLNSQLKASDNEPVSIYFKDFDNNGSLDAVLCHYDGGVSYPLLNRDRLLSQMIMLRKRFTRYEPYAKATINEIFTPQELQGATIFKANNLKHTLFKNTSGTSFTATSLPDYTQISVLNSAQTLDADKDGNKDLIVGGNFYGTDAEFGRYDASIGALLLGDGNLNFKVVPPAESGFVIPGNVQHITPITIGGEQYYWIVRNNDESSLLKLK
ncbi:VCBS repeat-containing protein [Planktosalinus lacus]|uniref:ASPIC/UnbV domain-containing protein n=1 Tax=Planktosalinus lacus TaxID=1526573 RepID=A0A8J2V9Y5_9FLAO|nr:VCBS repeat-containing protein [Planktosalinus lacus]GGD94831.1 hypothetical protein GCM10011312_18140 [Planktosalinus lacus]